MITSILLFKANILKIGKRRKVVAVLLVNSVKKEVIMATINIRVNNLNELKIHKSSFKKIKKVFKKKYRNLKIETYLISLNKKIEKFN